MSLWSVLVAAGRVRRTSLYFYLAPVILGSDRHAEFNLLSASTMRCMVLSTLTGVRSPNTMLANTARTSRWSRRSRYAVSLGIMPVILTIVTSDSVLWHDQIEHPSRGH